MNAFDQAGSKTRFDINFKGFLLPVESAAKGERYLYEITFPDTSKVQIEKKERHFRMIRSTLSRYLRYFTGDSRIQEFGSLIEETQQTKPADC